MSGQICRPTVLASQLSHAPRSLGAPGDLDPILFWIIAIDKSGTWDKTTGKNGENYIGSLFHWNDRSTFCTFG